LYRRNVADDFEIVEAGFADPNDSVMARRGYYPIERNVVSRAFGMHTRARPDVRMARGDVYDCVVGCFVDPDAQKSADPVRTRRRQLRVRVVEVVQMAVRVDQHAYMVCV
jgi:hypothetical protein